MKKSISNVVSSAGKLVSWWEGEEQFTVTRNGNGKPVLIESVLGKWTNQKLELKYSAGGDFIGYDGHFRSQMFQTILEEAEALSPVSGGGLVSTTSYASAAALEAAYPAATNSGKQGVVGTAIYYSNGTAWTATGSSSYDADVTAYAARIAAAGGSIDAGTLAAVDKLVRRGKFDGWWSKLTIIAPFLGSGLSAALQVLKSPTLAPLTNIGFSESDYTQSAGIGNLSSNTSKYIDTGFAPGANGATYQDFSFGVDVLNIDTSFTNVFGGNYLLGSVAQPSGSATIGVFDDGAIGYSTAAISGAWWGLGMFGATSGTLWGWRAGVKNGDGGSAPNTVMSYPITIHCSRRGGDNSLQYAKAKTGMFFAGLGMTATEQQAFVSAYDEYRAAIYGRATGAVLVVGDSIASGLFVSRVEYTWPLRLASACGGQGVIQVAQGNGRVSTSYTTTVPHVSSLMSKYTQVYKYSAKLTALLIGTNDLGADAALNGTAGNITTFQNDCTTIYNALRRNMRGRVLAISGPYRTDTGTHSLTKQTAYNAAHAAAAKAAGVVFVDLYRAFLDLTDPASVLSGGLHPNDAGQLIITEYAKAGFYGALLRKPSLDFSATTSIAVTVPNAVAGMPVRVVPLSQPSVAGVQFYGVVTANDTVTVTASGNVAAQYFRLEVECGY